jgi:hypothetical protein
VQKIFPFLQCNNCTFFIVVFKVRVLFDPQVRRAGEARMAQPDLVAAWEVQLPDGVHLIQEKRPKIKSKPKNA